MNGSTPSITSGVLNMTVAIAPKISLKGKYTISPSIDFTYGKTTFNQVRVVDTIHNLNEKQYGG
jgi:hypothetical protein